ncbi:hypothetical protein Q8A73_018408 [Channa argus]|nr:hypothetical protein Q8A73_018408 [Channa argus]
MALHQVADSYSHDESITQSGSGIKASTKPCCLRPTEMSGSWLSVPAGELPLAKALKTQAQTQTGALNLALSPSMPGTTDEKMLENEGVVESGNMIKERWHEEAEEALKMLTSIK